MGKIAESFGAYRGEQAVYMLWALAAGLLLAVESTAAFNLADMPDETRTRLVTVAGGLGLFIASLGSYMSLVGNAQNRRLGLKTYGW